MAAQSADGLWHWDGSEWWTSISLDHEEPAELANSLDRLAEEQYCQAGMILARRRREWRTPDDLAPLVDEAHFMLQRLDRMAEARDAFAAALACPVNGAERDCIERKLASTSPALPLPLLRGRGSG